MTNEIPPAANYVAGDPLTTPPGWYPDGNGSQRWWTGLQWTENALPDNATGPIRVPGRTLGFICGLIAMLFVVIPFISIPLGIVGWIQSLKAFRRLPPGTRGRRLASTGLTLSILALVITAVILVNLIPGTVKFGMVP